MESSQKKAGKRVNRSLVLIAIFIFSITLSLVIFGIVHNSEQTHFEFEFGKEARKQADRIVDNFHEYQVSVQFVGNFLDNTVGASRKEFRGFVENVLDRYPSMRAISWNPRIKLDQRAIYEDLPRKNGFKTFQFVERDHSGKLVRAGDREEYVVVYYIEPLKGNEAALGFDIASNKKRLKTINQATDTGKITITEKILLVQDKEKQPGALILFPLYKHGVSIDSVESRRKYLEGFSVGVLNIGTVIQSSLDQDSVHTMNLYLYDESSEEGERFLYHLTAEGDPVSPVIPQQEELESSFHWSTTFNVGGRTWKLILKPSNAYLDSHRSYQSLVLLVGMAAFSLFLIFYLYKSHNHTVSLEREITERQIAERKLNQYKEQLEDTVRKRTYDLKNRVKELNCLYGIYQLVEARQESSEKLYQKIVNLIPPSWQYPEITCARITLNHEEFLTEGFEESPWKLECDIIVYGKNIGTLEVYYLKEIPNAQGTPFLDEEKSLIHAIAEQLQHITERKQYEEAIIQARINAEDANRAKSEFLRTMSHELRTPLTVILGNINILTDTEDLPDEEEIVDIAKDIEDSGKHLLTLINDLLDLSKIEAGKMELNIADLKTSSLMSEIQSHVKVLSEQKGLNLEMEIEDFNVKADPIRLKQVLLNLISNSIKFTKQGFVKISVSRSAEFAVFQVEDSGCGINDKALPYIFDPFRQADSSTTRAVGGTGLGLAITKKLVTMHGGAIEVTSQVDTGSTFSFTIPFN